MAYRILIVDDEKALSRMVEGVLQKEGFFRIYTAVDCKSAELLTAENEFQMILLDVMLPDGDGFSLYKVMRETEKNRNTPVIFLSARDEDYARLKGLGLGADDYMIKPFETKELVARVKAVLRRYHLPQSAITPNESSKCVTYPDLVVNLDNYSVTYYKKSVEMPPKELELLYFLASAPNQVFTREQLLDNIWGYDYIGDTRTVDVHIKRIREKINDHDKWAIETVWGIGYKFVTR